MSERRKGKHHYDVLQLIEERIDWVAHCRTYLQLTNQLLQELKLECSIIHSSKQLELNTSSVRDLAMLTLECMKFPLFKEVVGALYREIPLTIKDEQGRWSSRVLDISNPNRLMRDYKFKGVKTSYSFKFGGSSILILRLDCELVSARTLAPPGSCLGLQRQERQVQRHREDLGLVQGHPTGLSR